MPDLEPYHILIAVGRAYQLVLFFYGFTLLVRLRLWLLLTVALVAGACYGGFTLLAVFGAVPPSNVYRLLGVYGPALFAHVPLLVVNTLANRQSLGRLKPFEDGPYADA